jgi:hypothetical protein
LFKRGLPPKISTSIGWAGFRTVIVIDAHREGGGVRGGIKVFPPSKILVKIVNKNAKKTKKVYPPPKFFTTPIYPPSQNLAHGPSLRIFKPCASVVVADRWALFVVY